MILYNHDCIEVDVGNRRRQPIGGTARAQW